jgi:hypothetical protein
LTEQQLDLLMVAEEDVNDIGRGSVHVLLRTTGGTQK